ncbi:tRNA1(Val) (adenine(37)-N6)-methyltransferase [Shewanella intestini]|uniref:tRNA1(Val) (adenine(37)-N6)-methyltransferase n=1 Tax=Shewanella intestini TaxID=2017544 RepID=A0ABS5I6Q8_9GAMM|nr:MULTISPECIES: methyltransferase [Shewanella]MBR9729419.1 methyltransferase [Shewanella intestini]MRG37499.1 methyltransferase [Shewanella sp. XMDDZSB0408]
MPFTFKQFHINDDLCGMRISTDAVLLGAWATIPSKVLQDSVGADFSAPHQTTNIVTQASSTPKDLFTILDIGSGSGILSLMAAQRTSANVHITAIEIDPQAVKQSRENIANSPWPQKIAVIEGALQQVANTLTTPFDHIVCNPPYFDNGPQANNGQRANARHSNSLTFTTLLNVVEKLLAPAGQANFILPINSLNAFTDALSSTSMALRQQVNVATVEHKPATRVLLTLTQSTLPTLLDQTIRQMDKLQKLHIQDKNGHYSQQMSNLCRDFYLKL